MQAGRNVEGTFDDVTVRKAKRS